MHEIIETEKTYQRQISLVLDIYVENIREIACGAQGRSAQKALGIDLELISFAFGPNLQEVLTLSDRMLADLNIAIKCPGDTANAFASALLENAAEMHGYAPYNTAYSSVYIALKNASAAAWERNSGLGHKSFRSSSKASKNFMALWEIFSAKHAGKETMFSFIIKPVQRIPRYGLLARELSKAAAADPSQSPATVKLLERVRDIFDNVTRQINESVRQHEKLVRFFGEELTAPTSSKVVTFPTQDARSGDLKTIQNVYSHSRQHSDDAARSPRLSLTGKLDLEQALMSQSKGSRKKLSTMF